jgi:hypothetical protein
VQWVPIFFPPFPLCLSSTFVPFPVLCSLITVVDFYL